MLTLVVARAALPRPSAQSRSRCCVEAMGKRKPPKEASEPKLGKPSEEAGKPKFTDVGVTRLHALSGGLLKKPLVLPTRVFGQGVGALEFTRLRKGEQWLVHASVGAVKRQISLGRTKLVEEVMKLATDAAFQPAVDTPPLAAAPAEHDPMDDVGYDAAPPAPAIAESAKRAKRRALRDRLVHVEAPAKCREMYPGCQETRKVTCYVQCAGTKQVWISLEDVPWLVRSLHDQATLAGVPLFVVEGDSPPPALAGEDAAKESLVAEGGDILWDFTTDAWGAQGKQLKPEDVSREEAAALGVDVAALQALSYKDRKQLAYDVMRSSFLDFQ